MNSENSQICIISYKEKYLEQTVEIFDEYRVWCGAESNKPGTKHFVEDLTRNEHAITLLALDESNDQIVGLANCYISFSTIALRNILILNDLAITKSYRGKHVSKILLHEIKKLSKRIKANQIQLKTAITNTVAQRLYKKAGFNLDGEHFYYTLQPLE